MIAWTIAGSDSGGGAGIQADLKTFAGLGAHGCSVITALTAQNTCGVRAVSHTSPQMISEQIQALRDDLAPKAVKTGMLGCSETIAAVVAGIQTLECPVVCDPVMVATSGDALLDEDARTCLVEKLLPLVTLVTPNRPEAEVLAQMSIHSTEDVHTAAERILAMGVGSVLIKGGHSDERECADYWTNGERSFWLTSPRLPINGAHGSGCTLSAAITAALALDFELADALVIAKAYVQQGIRLAKTPGKGSQPVFQGGWPDTPEDMPSMEPQWPAQRLNFPACGSLGFYPIVDRVAWMARILPLGVKTVQLRIKDLEGEALEQELVAAIALAEQHDCRLFINDYWQDAIRLGAYGVHLGQEDIETADLAAIAKAGLRLGVSTHCYYEVARARALKPSYMAIGPIFETQTKVMRFGPQGLERLRLWRRCLVGELVAIAGIKLHNAGEVLAAGADSIAVITAVTEAPDPEAAVKQWLKLFQNQTPNPKP